MSPAIIIVERNWERKLKVSLLHSHRPRFRLIDLIAVVPISAHVRVKADRLQETDGGGVGHNRRCVEESLTDR